MRVGIGWLLIAALPTLAHAASPLYLGTDLGVYKSVDGGASFSLLSTSVGNAALATPVVESLAVNPANPSKLYFTGTQGNTAALYSSSTGGQTWSATILTTVVPVQGPKHLAVDRGDGIVYLIGQRKDSAKDSFLYKSADGGATWTGMQLPNTPAYPAAQYSFGPNPAFVFTDPATSGVVYASDTADLFRSSDFGATWQIVSAAIANTSAPTGVLQVDMDPSSPLTFYELTALNINGCDKLPGQAQCTLHKSTDGGATWTGISVQLTYANSFAWTSSPDAYYIGYGDASGGGFVKKSTDGGSIWTVLASGFRFPGPTVRTDPSDPTLLYVIDSNVANPFYRSSDGGAHLVKVPLPNGPPGCTTCRTPFLVNDVLIAAPGAAANPFTTKNAASYAAVLAPSSIAYAEAPAIASALDVVSTLDWPNLLDGVRIDVTDSQGQTRPAPIYYVATGSAGYLVPAGTALGTAQAKLTTSAGMTYVTSTVIKAISPGLFSADATGSGAPAGIWVRVSGGQQSYGYLFDVNTRAPAPVDLGPSTDLVYLSLYGTGMRGYSGVAAKVGGMVVPVYGVAAQGTYLGEDVINIGPLPRSLAGNGSVDVAVSIDGTPANILKVAFQ